MRVATGFGRLGAASGGGGGLTASQQAALDAVMLDSIEDFTGTLRNFWPLGVPAEQVTGTFACTTYNFTAAGLEITTSHQDTEWKGTNGAKSPGFYRFVHDGGFDVALDIDQIADQSTSVGADWTLNFLVAIGGSHRHDSMFGARLRAGNPGGTFKWWADRVVSPSWAENYDGSNGASIDSTELASKPSSIRLRLQHSVANSGFKASYSLDGGSNYTALEGANGGTGWFQMYPRYGGTRGYANRQRVGGSVMIMCVMGQNVSKTAAQGQQGTARVKFVNLS